MSILAPLPGILFSLVGGLVLTETIFRGFRSWHARRANGSVARTEPLLRRVRPTKSLLGEPLLDPPPLRYWEAMHVIFRGIGSLVFAAAGVYLLLGVSHWDDTHARPVPTSALTRWPTRRKISVLAPRRSSASWRRQLAVILTGYQRAGSHCPCYG